MKALVYAGATRIALEDRPDPAIHDATDAIVRVTKTTICETDLHILTGGVPACSPGRILGHEGIGVVETIGASVTLWKPGDRVLISCITACGACAYCRRLLHANCSSGGWMLGHTIDGTQAELVRIPHADASLYAIPDGADEDGMVMLSDILPTGFECGVLNGKVEPGNTVAVVGAGPLGLAAILTSAFYAPAQIISIDSDDHRLEVAKSFGATAVIDATKGQPARAVRRLTLGRGVDTAIEALGASAALELCQQITTPGGTIARVGVHAKKVDLHWEELWDHDIAIATRLLDGVSTPMLLSTVAARRISPRRLVTHRFPFNQMLAAYDTFGHATKNQALKVIVEA